MYQRIQSRIEELSEKVRELVGERKG